MQRTFKALANPVRREILNLLKKQDMSASDIANHFKQTNATISHHLSILKECDLIEEHKEKNFIFYHLNVSVVDEILCYFNELRGINNEKD